MLSQSTDIWRSAPHALTWQKWKYREVIWLLHHHQSVSRKTTGVKHKFPNFLDFLSVWSHLATAYANVLSPGRRTSTSRMKWEPASTWIVRGKCLIHLWLWKRPSETFTLSFFSPWAWNEGNWAQKTKSGRFFIGIDETGQQIHCFTSVLFLTEL